MMMATEESYVNKTALKEIYGLTDSWIKRLGDPDMEKPNPHYKSASSMKLYLRQRVEIFIDENRAEWERLQKTRQKRQAASQAVRDRRINEILDWAESVPITVTDKLPKNASRLHRKVMERGFSFHLFFVLSHNAVIAHIRHSYTNYDQLLNELEGRPGKNWAYEIIRERCDEIADRVYAEILGANNDSKT